MSQAVVAASGTNGAGPSITKPPIPTQIDDSSVASEEFNDDLGDLNEDEAAYWLESETEYESTDEEEEQNAKEEKELLALGQITEENKPRHTDVVGGTYIARIYALVQRSLHLLGVDEEVVFHDAAVCERLEQASIFIHESMSSASRNYHSVQHVFDVGNIFAGRRRRQQSQPPPQPVDTTTAAVNTKKDRSSPHKSKPKKQRWNDPIAVLAAIFHDCVYYHVDGGLSPMQAARLKGVLDVESNKQNKISEYIPHGGTDGDDQDAMLGMLEEIFGYTPGQKVTHLSGLNEFLSAVICARELEPVLKQYLITTDSDSENDKNKTKEQRVKVMLAQMATCIEATIPFRGDASVVTEQGSTPAMERLYQNLCRTNEKYNLGMTDEECIQAVQRAVRMANQDVANFGTTDPGYFLDNTWNLLPETNEALRSQYLYTVQEFQCAVFKMYGFFRYFLAEHPYKVFYTFRNVPDHADWTRRTARAKRNLEVGRKYMAAKLLSISVLAAFAELTGGDAPISLFMGDLPTRTAAPDPNNSGGKPPKQTTRRLSDAIPSTVLPSRSSSRSSGRSSSGSGNSLSRRVRFDLTVHSLLSQGRKSESSFDIKQSPLAAYYYMMLGDDAIEEILTAVKVYPLHEDQGATAKKLLCMLPTHSLETVANGMADVALSRAHRIRAVLQEVLTLKQQQEQGASGTGSATSN